MEYIPQMPVQQQLILCCSCGVPIPPNPANMCVDCIRGQVDITEGIQKQLTIYYCRNCDRYLQPPNQYVACELESRELLALCLKRLKLTKVRLVDAGFIWTEPHSKRIKVKVVIQKEVFTSTILQQEFVVEYIVANQNCDECHRTAAKDHWNAVVQVRQKVDHKKTFFYIEQLIIKHRAAAKTVNIKDCTDGLDFYFAAKSDAAKMVDFFNNVAPIRLKTSERLISTDIQNNTANYKFTFSVEIVPVCKDDLVCLPTKVASRLGNISPLCLVTRVATSLYLVDPLTLQTTDISNNMYWRAPFRSLCSYKFLSEYVVLNVEPLGPTRGKFVLADIEVARVSDFGYNDVTFTTRTHLGGILHPGDSCLAYDLTNLNANDENFDKMKSERIPYVVIVKKHYPNRRKVQARRKWKLQQLAKIQDGGTTKKDEEREQLEYEMFMRDLEEDKDLRATVNIYRDETVAVDAAIPQVTEDGEYVEDDFPEVQLEEMLQALTLDDAQMHDPAMAAHHAALEEQQRQMQMRDLIGDMNMQMEH